MDGDQILRNVIEERLDELARLPENLRSEGAGRITSFCLGAADACNKAGLLAEGHPAALDYLNEQLKSQKLAERVTVTVGQMSSRVVRPTRRPHGSKRVAAPR